MVKAKKVGQPLPIKLFLVPSLGQASHTFEQTPAPHTKTGMQRRARFLLQRRQPTRTGWLKLELQVIASPLRVLNLRGVL